MNYLLKKFHFSHLDKVLSFFQVFWITCVWNFRVKRIPNNITRFSYTHSAFLCCQALLYLSSNPSLRLSSLHEMLLWNLRCCKECFGYDNLPTSPDFWGVYPIWLNLLILPVGRPRVSSIRLKTAWENHERLPWPRQFSDNFDKSHFQALVSHDSNV